ncbi:MAG TPA: LytR C-terminal domain-containing protein [Gaiellaceae bacterium]
MDAPLSPDALIRPWRTATLVASLVAAVELVLLVGAGLFLVAKPLAHAVKQHAESSALAPATKERAIVKAIVRNTAPRLTRGETGVWVFNGNGRAGAASTAASQLGGIGYVVRGKGNASRQDYATTVVMYRKGFQAEGERLARDLHVKVVGPLDGLKPSALHGAQLAVVLGAA